MKNRMLLSILGGLLVTAGVYALTRKSEKEKKLYEILNDLGEKFNARLVYDLDKSKYKGGYPDKILFQQEINELYERSLSLADRDSIYFTEDHKIAIELSGVDVEDTARVLAAFLASQSISFWELYDQGELLPVVEKLKKLEEDQYKQKHGQTFSPEDTNIGSPEIKELLAISEQREIEKKMQKESLINFSRSYADNKFTAEIGTIKTKDTAAVRNLLNDTFVTRAAPSDAVFLFGKTDRNHFVLYAIKTNGQDEPPIDERFIRDASQGYDHDAPNVSLELNNSGANRWERLTEKNKGRYLAILVDNLVLSAPRVDETIRGGLINISGDFSLEEAQDMARYLKTGNLPFPLVLVQHEFKKIHPPFVKRYRDQIVIFLSLIIFSVLGYFLFPLIKKS